MSTENILANRANFIEACHMQSEACAALGSSFTAQLCQLMAAHPFSSTALEEKLATWPGDITYRVHSVPLRLCGAFNALARSGQSPSLTALYPPRHASQLDEHFWQVLDQAVLEFEDQILAQIEFAPQTNEVRRASALMPALLNLSAQCQLPINLYEMGASAGLNLALDHFAYQFAEQHFGPEGAPFTLQPDWQGPTPPHTALNIASRAGCDLNPLNTIHAENATRLMSYIWPDQIKRVARTEKAINLANQLNIKIDAADAASWLKQKLADLKPGQLHVVYNTVAFQYFPAAAQQEIRNLLAAKGAEADAATPLVWLQLEVDGQKPGFAITQQLWPAGNMVELGRADAHGRWVTWHEKEKPIKL